MLVIKILLIFTPKVSKYTQLFFCRSERSWESVCNSFQNSITSYCSKWALIVGIRQCQERAQTMTVTLRRSQGDQRRWRRGLETNLAETFDDGRHLALTDLFIFLLLVGSFQALPWKTATVEVHHDVAERFHVITPTATTTLSQEIYWTFINKTKNKQKRSSSCIHQKSRKKI